ncbi:MAG: YqgE/AlgH family protein [Candidatus Rokuibacteriota bacterium]|jgi:putative transcriptional regulator
MPPARLLTRAGVVLGVLAGLAWAAAAPSSPAAAPAPRAIAQAGPGLAGQFLVATDTLRDPRFARTVIYIVRHDASGAMGLVVNRPVRDMPLGPMLRKFGLDDRGVTGSVRAHYGGPVEIGQGFLLHTAEYATQGTSQIAGDIAMTPTPGVLTALSDIAHGAGPRKSLFAVGYAGWAPGQLEGEIERGAWITVPADEALLFDEDHARKWDRATARRRITI